MTEEQLIRKHDCNGIDCFIAAAAIAGGASLLGGVTSAIGSSTAAGEQASAANTAAQLQEQQFQQTQANQQPYMNAGTTALSTIGSDQANGTGFAAPFNPSTYIDTPGYQFQQQQGTNAINSSAAATGGTLNGGTLKALAQYTTGLANSTYGDAYSRYLANSNQQYNQLFNVAQLGENATQSTGAQGAAAANAAGNYTTQAGSATAAGTLGVTSGINQGISGLGTLATAGYLNNQGQSGYGTGSNSPYTGNYYTPGLG